MDVIFLIKAFLQWRAPVDKERVKVFELKGKHHFGGDYELIIRSIVSQSDR